MTGAVIITAFALLMGSLSFWFVRADMFGKNMVNSMVGFSTYPDGIFKGGTRFLLYLVIPVGMSGGIAYDKVVVAGLKEKAEWIAPMTVYPGEDELLALVQGGLRVLNGEEKAMVY